MTAYSWRWFCSCCYCAPV